MKVAVVGAGPAGSLLSYHLARSGASVTAFDASHPREKPCGGGVTAKALALLPPAPPADPLPARFVEACRFESGTGESVDLALAKPVAVASRRELDAWLLRRAIEAGAEHVSERVVGVDGAGRVRTTAGRDERFDHIVGADGAGSLVRRSLHAPLPPERLAMALGWFARGTAPMLVRFTPGLDGYLWLFPRPDHVGVGICAPLASVPTREIRGRLEAEVAKHFPALADDGTRRYAHTIPSPTADPASLLDIAGPRWALVGDAAGLTDPITGEGIYYALRSAVVLADTLRTDGSTARYPERALADFGRELLKAAALRDRFYAPGFVERMIRYASRSEAIRSVLGDLVLGEQGYLDLKRRLLWTAPRFLLQSARVHVKRGVWGAA
ncbi:MAG TPA: NAD(P)/FAD-dependent oxidoreductase [Vicinamibacteria bacterium]